MAHTHYRVAERIRQNCEPVNKIISCVKKIFLKAPLREKHYKKMNSKISLPSQPLLTRWRTWIPADLFYEKNWNAIQNIVKTFDISNSSAIFIANDILPVNNILKNIICD